MIIAIDGPSGAGKSTVAKLISKELGIEYLDTGAMYRAFAYKLYKHNISGTLDIKNVLEDTEIDYNNNNVYLDGVNVEGSIRTENISILYSQIAKLDYVREKIVEMQRNIGKSKDIIVDGRDIGSVVFPEAEFKFYVTANAETRAKRRYEELKAKGQNVVYEEVLKDINERDHNDTTRKNSPLVVAKNAVVVDTSELSIEEVVDKIIAVVKGEKK